MITPYLEPDHVDNVLLFLKPYFITTTLVDTDISVLLVDLIDAGNDHISVVKNIGIGIGHRKILVLAIH